MIIDIDNFMGFVIKETTSTQLKKALTDDGISFKEYPDYFDKNKNSVTFPYRLSDITWNCELQLENNVLKHVVLNVYSPDSHKIYKKICKDLLERYGSIYNVYNRQDNDEGTETLSFANKDNMWKFTEIVYDSSPILGQKNIYIYYYA